jgi:GNAT superfamily N-acetyltransferase
MSPFSIRRAKASDADTLAEFRFRLSVEDAIAEGRPPPRRNATSGRVCRSWVVKGLRNRTLVRFLAQSSGGSPVGMGILFVHPIPLRPGAILRRAIRFEGLYSIPEARGQGVGSGMLSASIAWARKAGFKRIWLSTSRAAVDFCLSRGFRPVAEMVLAL